MTETVTCASCHDQDRWAVFQDGDNVWYCCDCWPKRPIRLSEYVFGVRMSDKSSLGHGEVLLTVGHKGYDHLLDHAECGQEVRVRGLLKGVKRA